MHMIWCMAELVADVLKTPVASTGLRVNTWQDLSFYGFMSSYFVTLPSRETLGRMADVTGKRSCPWRLLSLVLFSAAPCDALSRRRTPVMGWSSWSVYGCNVNEEGIKAQAQAVVDLGLRDAGYEYMYRSALESTSLIPSWLFKKHRERG